MFPMLCFVGPMYPNQFVGKDMSGPGGSNMFETIFFLQYVLLIRDSSWLCIQFAQAPRSNADCQIALCSLGNFSGRCTGLLERFNKTIIGATTNNIISSGSVLLGRRHLILNRRACVYFRLQTLVSHIVWFGYPNVCPMVLRKCSAVRMEVSQNQFWSHEKEIRHQTNRKRNVFCCGCFQWLVFFVNWNLECAGGGEFFFAPISWTKIKFQKPRCCGNS